MATAAKATTKPDNVDTGIEPKDRKEVAKRSSTRWPTPIRCTSRRSASTGTLSAPPSTASTS